MRGLGALEKTQLLEGPVITAVEGAFVADQHGQALLLIGNPLKDPGQAIIVVHVGEFPVDILGAAFDFGAKQVGFDGAEAAQAPAGDGHGLDQVHLDAAGGLELVDVGLAEELKVLDGFAREDDGFGAESMAEAVAGRGGLSFGGDGTLGFGAVGAGGFAFGFRWHVAPPRG
jgi:hypothetical protein